MGNRENKLYHFVGIKSPDMGSLVLVLHQKGYDIQRSDVEEYFSTQRDLEKLGVPILSFNADNIGKNMIVIAENAFPNAHEKTARAIELSTRITRYHDFVTRFIEPYASIAVTGLHGKAGATGLLAHVLGGINPTGYSIGSGTGRSEPDTDFFAFETCEYHCYFLACPPDYTTMTNIDSDHLDYYKSIEGIFSASQTMAHQVRKGVLTYDDDEYLRQLESEVPVYYYGVSEEDDIQARDIQRTMEDSSSDIYYKGDFVGYFVLSTLGHRNTMNALGVIVVAYFEKLGMQRVIEEILNLKGVKRRLSRKKVSDMIIADDYAHHPAEIKVTIDDARQGYPGKEVIAVFQSRIFTRTIALVDEFAEALDLTDEVFLCNIFNSTRETQGGTRIGDLGEKIQKDGQVITKGNASLLLDFENTVVAFMGTGDVQKLEQVYETLLSSTTRGVL